MIAPFSADQLKGLQLLTALANNESGLVRQDLQRMTQIARVSLSIFATVAQVLTQPPKAAD